MSYKTHWTSNNAGTSLGFLTQIPLSASGAYNIGIGAGTLTSITSGQNNFAIGASALGVTDTGSFNFAFGGAALVANLGGSTNFAFGSLSLNSNTTGGNNIGLGSFSLEDNIIGNNNVAIGTYAGNSALGDYNVFIGHNAGNSETGANKLYIGTNNNDLIYGEFDNALLRVDGTLEVSTTTGAFITPRMTAVQASALTPTAGMIVYSTDTDATFTSIGFWGYEDGSWVKL